MRGLFGGCGGGGALGAERNTVGVGGRVDGVDEFHVGDVVEVDLVFEDHDEAFAVEADGEDGGGEGELADGGASLVAMSVTAFFCMTCQRGASLSSGCGGAGCSSCSSGNAAHFGVGNDESSWAQDHRHEGS